MKISFTPKVDDRNIEYYRRENSFYKSLTLIDLDKGREVASVRFYGRASTVYCVAWIWPEGVDLPRGYGKAGGYGYHKESAAMQEAFDRAGAILSEPINGRGDGAMLDAMMALADVLNITRPYVHKAHA